MIKWEYCTVTIAKSFDTSMGQLFFYDVETVSGIEEASQSFFYTMFKVWITYLVTEGNPKAEYEDITTPSGFESELNLVIAVFENKIERTLARLGQQGWELVKIDGRGVETKAWLKRQLL